MMAVAVEILAELRSLGVTVEPGRDGRLAISPASRVPLALKERLKAHKPEVLALLAVKPDEVARRAGEFRRQIQEWVESGRIGVPLVALPDAPNLGHGHCCSCAAPLVDGETWRCRTCAAALNMTLDDMGRES